MKNSLKIFITILIYAMGLFHLYTGLFGTFESFFQRSVHLFFALLLIFLLHPYKLKNKILTIFLNLIVTLGTVISLSYLLLNYEYVLSGRYPFVTPLTFTEKILGIVLVVLVLEATRKMTGFVLPLVGLIFIIYGFIGPFLPGMLNHAGYGLDSILDLNYLGTEGLFGIPLGASATYIALFIIFGSFLAKSGLGSLLMDLAMGIAGSARGGPAKVSIVGSALHGILSGSAVANVLTVGTSTIPLMKKVGYKPHFAGGVEAAASAGSQIMPPVMGIIAFIMAQYTGIPYIKIAGYALLPAILFFWGIYVMVHYEAVKLDLKGLPKKELPDWKKSLKGKWHLLLPIVILLTLLILKYSPAYSVTYAILSIILFAGLKKETRLGFKQILEALQDGVKGILMIAVATATAGLISGMFGLTGLGIRFTAFLDQISNGNLLLALLLTAIAAFILGMGLPPSASYIVQVAITIPAIVSILETNPNEAIAMNALLLAHMFVMYYASIAVITPPDALASIAAAGVAGAKPMRTAVTATRLAFVAYFIPFLFVLNPAYIMIGTIGEIVLAVVNGFLAILAIGIASQGYFQSKLGWGYRIWAIVASICMLIPNIISSLVGIALIALFIISNILFKQQQVGTNIPKS